MAPALRSDSTNTVAGDDADVTRFGVFG